ncbi:hypothetical protein PTUN_a1232 [Pseudoalteromonas tunicata]|nr:hypothetical protein PTUN_a1232 [Pseudoalteromonas tunicata]
MIKLLAIVRIFHYKVKVSSLILVPINRQKAELSSAFCIDFT